MARYPEEVCPRCKKNHRKGIKSKNEKPMQQTFYYEPHLSNDKIPNEYRWKTYRCEDCNMVVMFITHHKEVKNATELNSVIDSMTIKMIKLNKNFKWGE